MFDFLDSPKLHFSIALIGAVAGFCAGTKIRNYTGDTSSPSMGAALLGIFFFLIAKYLAALALFLGATAIVILLILFWLTVSKAILIFAQKLACMLPGGFRTRSFHKRLASEHRRLEHELEQARSLNIDPRVKRRLLEKLETEGRNRLLDLADRSKSTRP